MHMRREGNVIHIDKFEKKEAVQDTVIDLVKKAFEEKRMELIPGDFNYDSIDDLVKDHLRVSPGLVERSKGDTARIARIITDAIIEDGGLVQEKKEETLQDDEQPLVANE